MSSKHTLNKHISNKQAWSEAEKQLNKLYLETIANPFNGVPTTPGELLAYLHKQIINGWRIVFSHNINVIEKDGKNYKLYILTAQLVPEGRGSTVEDWSFIGQVTGYIEGRINQDNNSDVRVNLITPIEFTHPNDIYKWYWKVCESVKKDQTND